MSHNKYHILKMKTIALSVFAILIVLYGCSSDDDNSAENGISSELVSVTENLYIGNTFTGFVKYLFRDKQLKKIEHTGGRYMLITYHEGLVSKIEKYNVHKALQWSVTYLYDELGRLILKKEVPHNHDLQLSIIEKHISYVDGNINVSLNFLDENNEIQASNFFLLSTSPEGYITSEKSSDSKSDKIVRYESGNPSEYHHSIDGIVFGKTTYNYSDEMASEVSQFKQYMFGTYWKNNLILDRQFNLDFDSVSLISDNYLTGYTYLQTDKQGEERSMTVVYEFNKKGRLDKQIKNIEGFNGTAHKIETIFEYL